MAQKTSRSSPHPRFRLVQTILPLFVLLALIGVFLGARLALKVASAQAASLAFALPSAGPHLVYTALKGAQSTLWVASAVDPSQEHRLATVSHQVGYGLKGSLSPMGKHIAYLVLPRGAREPATEASLWVMGLDGTNHRRLLSNVDLLSAPVWSPDEQRVLVRQASVSDGRSWYTLLLVDVESGSVTALLPATAVYGLYPIGWSQDGERLYYATITQDGTDIQRLELATGSVERALHASDGIARDFRLSRQGDLLLYSEYLPAGRNAYRVRTAELDTGTRRLFWQSSRMLLSPVWHPDDSGVTLGSEPAETHLQGGLGTLSLDTASLRGVVSPAPRGGFLVPLAWSPDGVFLAARLLRGADLQRTANERLVVASPDTGTTTPVTAGGYTEFVGWLP